MKEKLEAIIAEVRNFYGAPSREKIDRLARECLSGMGVVVAECEYFKRAKSG